MRIITDKVVLREFQYEDLYELKALIYRTIDESYEGIYAEAAKKFFYDYHKEVCILNDAGKGFTVVVELDGRIVGTGTLLGDDIRRVFISPEYQGMGIGKRIMSGLEKKARENGLTSVSLSASLFAKNFYDALGYETTLEGCDLVGDGEELRFYEMKKAV